ncbi:DUF885 domain-containing protein [Sphingomicrobium arenosum]|uniref:DUF885 domain-containing protein n=1 Tax=Sphingomicrobium arenosum TaxID=2233861 RepID=UPI0022402C76|nr:DUF885 domain-containing protein [Sphingomicrobium arenosum]
MKTHFLGGLALGALAAACAPVNQTVETIAAPIEAAAASEVANAAFDALAASYLDMDAQLDPVSATTRGDHRFDDRVTDLSASGRALMMAQVDRHLDWLAQIDRDALSRDRQVDAALLENALRYTRWQMIHERVWARDPQIYQGYAGGALYGLAARDFAPWDVRLKAATARMQALPRIFAAARANLDPALVPPIMAQTVASQHAGLTSIIDGMLAPHKDALSAADAAAFDAAYAALKPAIAEHQAWLNDTLVPNASGTHALGMDRYRTKLQFALQSPLSLEEIKAMAEATIVDSRDAMAQLATQALTAKGMAVPTDQQALIEAGLALSYAVRPEREELEQYARNLVDQSTDFTREKDFITIPPLNFEIITMPEFQQGYAVAYADPPGPQEQHLPAFYAVSPIPADWTDEQAVSFLSEYNHYMIHELNIHEAIPGHILQLAHSVQNDSDLRAVLWSGSFVEGWAVYSEEVMRELGYLDYDPLYQMTVHKMRLRAAANALLDIGIHTEGMTEAEAMELMTVRTFQQEREAAGKWVRANLGSTQLPTYIVGYLEHMALREEAEARLGDDFDLKAYHDAVLSHGSPPVRYARALMFDLPIE